MNFGKKKINFSNEGFLLIVLVVLGIALNILSNGIFLSSRNIATICLQTSVLGFLAIGINIIIILGGIDLSLDSVISCLVAIGAILNYKMGVNPILTLILMFAAAIVIASINGFVVAKFGVPAFIVTLAATMYLKGTSLVITNSKELAPVSPVMRALATEWVPTKVSLVALSVLVILVVVWTFYKNNESRKKGFQYESTGAVIVKLIPVFGIVALLVYISCYKGIPVMFVVLMIYAVLIHTFLSKTGMGRSFYATGANQEAARLAGVNPKKMLFCGFILMGTAYFLGSWASMARVSGYLPAIGSGIDTDAIASCVIGGTSLMGGLGTTSGALIGALLFTCIDNGMSILNVNTFYQYIVKGLILLFAVILNYSRKKN